MEPFWTSLVIVAAVVAVCSTAAAVWRELEARHRQRRLDSLRRTPPPAEAATPPGDRETRQAVLADALERMTQPGALTELVDVPLDIEPAAPALHARDWDETVPMVALGDGPPHALTRDSLDAAPASAGPR